MTKTRCTHKTKKGAQCKGKFWGMCGVHKPGKKKGRKRKKKTTTVSKKKRSGHLALPLVAQTVGYKKPGPKKKVSKGMAGRMALGLISKAYS